MTISTRGTWMLASAVLAFGPLAACGSAYDEPTPAEARAAAALDNRGQYLEDQAISSKVAAALTAEPRFRDADVHVGTLENTVTLSGYVRSGSDIGYAEDLAMNVPGVRAVRNALVIR